MCEGSVEPPLAVEAKTTFLIEHKNRGPEKAYLALARFYRVYSPVSLVVDEHRSLYKFRRIDDILLNAVKAGIFLFARIQYFCTEDRLTPKILAI